MSFTKTLMMKRFHQFQIRKCNTITDHVYYRLYTSPYSNQVNDPITYINNLEPIITVVDSNDQRITTEWMNSHLRKTILEGKRDDIFLL
jgi:hypothetical protein